MPRWSRASNRSPKPATCSPGAERQGEADAADASRRRRAPTRCPGRPGRVPARAGSPARRRHAVDARSSNQRVRCSRRRPCRRSGSAVARRRAARRASAGQPPAARASRACADARCPPSIALAARAADARARAARSGRRACRRRVPLELARARRRRRRARRRACSGSPATGSTGQRCSVSTEYGWPEPNGRWRIMRSSDVAASIDVRARRRGRMNMAWRPEQRRGRRSPALDPLVDDARVRAGGRRPARACVPSAPDGRRRPVEQLAARDRGRPRPRRRGRACRRAAATGRRRRRCRRGSGARRRRR